MKILWWILGIVFSIAGLLWIIALMGEVLSRSEGFTSFSARIWGYVIFHTMTMALGLLFIDFALKGRRITHADS